MSVGRLTELHPSFRKSIGDVFDRARKGKQYLSIVSPHKEGSVPVSEILEMHDPRYVSAITDQIRRVTEDEWLNRFSARDADHRLVNSVLSIDAEAAYPLMTMWTGYVREQAARAIASIPGPFCLAMLVHRMNDWVPEVRAASEHKLASTRRSIDIGTAIGCIELLWDFDRYGRASSSAHSIVAALLHDRVIATTLRREVVEGKSDRALRISRRLLRTSELDDSLASIAVANSHPGIRANAMRALLTGSYDWKDKTGPHRRTIEVGVDRQAMARTALKDRHPGVQLTGLEYVVNDGRSWDDYQSILFKFVADPRASLALFARWGLDKAGIDWIVQVRGALTDGKGPDPNMARVLGEYGTVSDGERIWALASTMSDEPAMPFLAAAAQQEITGAVERLRHIATQGHQFELARRASKALSEARIWLNADDLKQVADSGEEFVTCGLKRHFEKLSVVAQLNILARLEKAHADIDLDAWFAVPSRKINRGRFVLNEGDKSELEFLLTHAPKVRGQVRRLLFDVFEEGDPNIIRLWKC